MKRTNRFLSILLTLILCVSMFPVSSLTALAAEATNVKYIDENGVEQICSSATIVEDASSKVEWGNGWYVVNEDVTISDTSTSTHLAVNVTGDNVHLILADGCTLTVQGMIYGENGASLTIYRQSLGTGKLDVTTTIDTSVAAIFFKYSSLTINGGTIDVDNTIYSTGGGWGINAEILTINGGTITAKAGSPIKSDDEKYYSGTITTIDSSNGNATETKTYCCVKFDTNGGTAVDKVGLEVGSTLTTLPAPTRAGYALVGWYMPDSSTKVTTATTFSADTTITAKWLEISATPIAMAITYGQTLADSALTEGWVWADNTIVPTVANSGYTAYYAIADDINYDWSAVDGYNAAKHRLERTATITVAKGTPVVDSKPTASRVIIGGKLSDSILTDGVASVPGTFAWKDGAEILNTATTVQKTVVFTPYDTANYNIIEFNVDVTVVLRNAANPNYVPDSPQTGDAGVMHLWIIMAVSAFGIIAIIGFGKKSFLK